MSNTPTYQIYTFGYERPANAKHSSFLKWTLHAESHHKRATIYHAKMLILSPEYERVQIEKIYSCPQTGQKKSCTLKTYEKTRYDHRSGLSSLGFFKKMKAFMSAL